MKEKFEKYPARMNVARKMLELGLRIADKEKIYCGNLEISDAALARAADVDRRVIKSTIKVILEDELLASIFTKITPAGTLLKNISSSLGFGVVEIEAGGDNQGILANATALISKENISIRQAYATDPDMTETPVLTIITDTPLPGELIGTFLNIEGISKVSIIN